ncbi:ATP-binding protein [uncultured Draconibacterium sp.]|uniref:ATP-binding protein n=1 Tax=uncultured Draconibacterium sp. TaxID=1573823 RepID=UPI003216AD30
MISNAIKLKITEALRHREEIEGNRIKLCSKLDLHPSALSRILSGDTEKVLSTGKWISLARYFNIPLENEVEFVTARTATFEHIWRQLEFAQEYSVSGMLCDRADIGKTHAAQVYARENKNVVYIDCGLVKTTQRFIRHIAKGFGLDHTGPFYSIREDLVYYIKTLHNPKPLIILDEFGDLPTSVYLEFKSLWNATDHYCGFYAMGADGLKNKIDKMIAKKIVGFAEIFSRMGNKFQRITPLANQDFKKFQNKQIAKIGRANGVENIQALHAKTDLSLRRIPIQLGLERKEKETAKTE